MPISIPIEIGDVILAGRFKNKKITVKEIGVDDYGLPTINGKGIMKIRVEKLMPPKQKKNESRLEILLKRLIKEERQKLLELEVTDPDLERRIQEYARLSDEMDRLKAELESLKKQFQPLDDELTAMMEQVEATGDRAIETRDLLITIKRKGYSASSVGYKDAFTQLYNKVNAAMKRQADEIIAANTSVKRIASSIGVQRKQESRITEAGFLQNLYLKVKNFLTSKLSFLKKNGSSIDSDIQKMKQIVGA